MAIMRPAVGSSKGVVLILCLVLVAACLGGCRGPVEGTGPGGQSPDIGFLQKASDKYVRVMSFNVGWDSIFADDDPLNDPWRQDSTGPQFVRMLQAIQPDVICLQEISSARDPQQVGDILDEALPLAGGERWQVHSGQDNVIAARFDLAMEAVKLVHLGTITNFGQAMALVDLDDGEQEQDLYLVCTHFKSQGGQANIQARQEHADAIVEWIADLKAPGGEVDLAEGTPIVVLGDLNVYDTDPAHHLTTLLRGDIEDEDRYGPDVAPDWDGSDLADALPLHNGAGPEVYTWRDDTQEFNPGVLDRILYTDSVLAVEHAFVLNTVTMAEEALEAAGLEAGDVMMDPKTGRYDHLPLVVDVSVGE